MRATVDRTDPVTSVLIPAGDVRFSGKIDARGGAGTAGGPGGQALIAVASNSPTGAEVEVRGVAAIDTSGGAGTTGGGTGGPILVRNPQAAGNRPSGGVAFHANLITKGGAAMTSGVGGGGGSISIQAGDLGVPEAGSQAVVGVGSIDTSGGNGVAQGGAAGPVNIVARERLDLFGNVTGVGGNQSGAGGNGGPAAAAFFRSAGALVASGTITRKGGNGAGAGSAGGSCSNLILQGVHVKATKALSCDGGNGTGAVGGNGGVVEITASGSPSSLSTVTAAAGTGTPNGNPGPITVDGNPL